MAGIKIEGLDQLEKALKKNVKMDDVKRVVRKNGSDMQGEIQDNADFDKGYQTGATHDSIMLDITNGGFSAEVEPNTEYSPYLEYGTRFMDAQPFVRPGFEKQKEKFKKDLQKLVR